MKFAVKAGVFALALLLSVAPAMACLLPITLTSAERECCKRMATECGRAGMPSRHSCCQRLFGPEESFIGASGAQFDHIAIASTAYALPVYLPRPLNSSRTQITSDVGFHGPPGSPPGTVSVLRI